MIAPEHDGESTVGERGERHLIETLTHAGDLADATSRVLAMSSYPSFDPNTGIGIAAKDLDRVLRPFEQVEGAMSRNHGGTGLGLPYSKRVIEIHGGTLTLTSQVNGGTTVHVELPASRVRNAAVAAHEPATLRQAS